MHSAAENSRFSSAPYRIIPHGAPQVPNDRRVMLCKVVAQRKAARRGVQTLHIDIVLDEDRQAEQQAAARRLCIQCARFLEDMRVQLRQHIEAVRPAASGQALQVFLHERFSPQRAAAALTNDVSKPALCATSTFASPQKA